ncbi:MAG TPA: hypothetical protein VE397_05130, partial [Stellaceae bacterium]|nr:hypothetical protein [Stellaceae bacterium]
MPLHWATLSFVILFATASVALRIHINNPEVFELRCLPANALLLHATGLCPHPSFNVLSWSISAEMCMYLLTPLL